jgi:hypothetical protein
MPATEPNLVDTNMSPHLPELTQSQSLLMSLDSAQQARVKQLSAIVCLLRS